MDNHRATREDPAPSVLPPSAALQALVRGDLAALAHRRRLRMLGFGVLGLALVAALALRTTHTSPAAGSLAFTVALIGFGACGLCLAGLAFGLTLPTGRRLRPVVALGIGVGLSLLGLMGSADPAHAVPLSHGGGCLLMGVGVSLGLFGLAVAFGRPVLRRHAPTGLLLGVGAGLMGLIPLHVGCPVLSLGHLLLWHGLVLGVTGGVAGLIWARVAPP